MSDKTKPDLVLECFVESELEEYKKTREAAVSEMGQLGKMRSDEGRVTGNPLALCGIVGALLMQILNSVLWWERVGYGLLIMMLMPAISNTIYKYSDRRIRFFVLNERIEIMNKLIKDRERWQRLTLEIQSNQAAASAEKEEKNMRIN